MNSPEGGSARDRYPKRDETRRRGSVAVGDRARPAGPRRPGSEGNGWHYGKTTYDVFGRVFQAFDASRETADYSDHGVRYVYNARGHVEKLQDAVGTVDAGGTFTPSIVYRTVSAVDARGNVTGETLGNRVGRRDGYDGQTGRLLSIRSGRLSADDRQHLAYDWDALGNLKSRKRTRSGSPLTETFTYDGLDRLKMAV